MATGRQNTQDFLVCHWASPLCIRQDDECLASPINTIATRSRFSNCPLSVQTRSGGPLNSFCVHKSWTGGREVFSQYVKANSSILNQHQPWRCMEWDKCSALPQWQAIRKSPGNLFSNADSFTLAWNDSSRTMTRAETNTESVFPLFEL